MHIPRGARRQERGPNTITLHDPGHEAILCEEAYYQSMLLQQWGAVCAVSPARPFQGFRRGRLPKFKTLRRYQGEQRLASGQNPGMGRCFPCGDAATLLLRPQLT